MCITDQKGVEELMVDEILEAGDTKIEVTMSWSMIVEQMAGIRSRTDALEGKLDEAITQQKIHKNPVTNELETKFAKTVNIIDLIQQALTEFHDNITDNENAIKQLVVDLHRLENRVMGMEK